MSDTQENINNGRFHWRVQYRHFGSDQGVTFRLLGPIDNESCELARFDCFKNNPHYHIAFYDHNTITAIEDKNPFEWSLKTCVNDFASLVSQCGGDQPTEQEMNNHAQALRTLRARGNHISSSHSRLRST